VATTVHIPKKLLEQVDARAKSLGVSRNRLVVEALRDKVGVVEAWPPELLAMLATPPEASVREAGSEMDAAIRRARRGRKKPLRL
jgi:hypothetical protein